MRYALRPQDTNVPAQAETGEAAKSVVVAQNFAQQNTALQTQQNQDEARDTLREWRQRWRHIMKDAVIYFDGIPQSQVERLRSYLGVLGSQVQPFFDQKVTHVISDNPRSDVAAKAKDSHRKVYTVEKLARFLSSLLGHSVTTVLDASQSAKLARMLEEDTKMSVHAASYARKDDFHYFRGPYLLLWDPSRYNRPMCIKEWKPSTNPEEGEWPQLRRAPMGMSPFTARSIVRSEKRKYHQQQLRKQELELELEMGAQAHAETTPDPSREQQRKQHHSAPSVPMPSLPENHKLVETHKMQKTHKMLDIATDQAEADGGEEEKECDIEMADASSSRRKAAKTCGNVDIKTNLKHQEESRAHDNINKWQHGAIVEVDEDEENKENIMPLPNTTMRPAPHPAHATNSTRLREFGEIVASGVPRYSQTSANPYSAQKESIGSREMVNLRRKVMPRLHSASASADAAATDSIVRAGPGMNGSLAVVSTGTNANASVDAYCNSRSNAQQNHRGTAPNSTAPTNPVKQRLQALPKPKAKKPGYCENCLEKYEDLGEHLGSKRHKIFAQSDQKFYELDLVIATLQRPRAGRQQSSR